MAKLVYIAHPIAGNVEENVRSVLDICKEIHSDHIIPIAPYLVALQYLSDHLTEERDLGIAANQEFFRRGVMDEVWVCGSHISEGMREEIKLALKYGIPIKCYSPDLQAELDQVKKEHLQNKGR